MPEYLAPGVYVEETSYRSKSIEGVSTTTTGFIGPTRYGPIDLEPDIITSLGEFERIYGDGQPLQWGNARRTNYMWHATRAFFEEGGRRLYVSRIFRGAEDDPGFATHLIPKQPAVPPAEGEEPPENPPGILVSARFPGAMGNVRVRLTLRRGPNILGSVGGVTTLGALLRGDVVWLSGGTKLLSTAEPPGGSQVPDGGQFYVAGIAGDAWQFADAADGVFALDNNQDPRNEARVVTLSIAVADPAGGGNLTVWDGLAFSDDHVSPSGVRDSVTALFERSPTNSTMARTLPIIVEAPGVTTPMDRLNSLLALIPLSGYAPTMSIDDFVTAVREADSHKALNRNRLITALGNQLPEGNRRLRRADVNAALAMPIPPPGAEGGPSVEDLFAEAFVAAGLSVADYSDTSNSIEFELADGNDGQQPTVEEYQGHADDDSTSKDGLEAFKDVEDISIVAAPGASDPFNDTAQAVQGLLLSHARYMRYRIAVLDSGPGMSIAEVRQQRGKIDSTYGALYFPWVRVMDPITREPIHLPPSGFVAGIYARNDVDRAVYKAPANEVVNLAIGFEQLLNKSQQDVLNPEGINCFRFFEGRGYRLWGARTVSSDPEWKYVNLRRYFAYLERSIDKGTQWVVFEPNGERLWANVRRTVEDFLFNEWQNGALLGEKPERAYFVKCDRSTMTQNDLDNGRLVCQIGVAALRPAEFVIFRIGQWTGDRRS